MPTLDSQSAAAAGSRCRPRAGGEGGATPGRLGVHALRESVTRKLTVQKPKGVFPVKCNMCRREWVEGEHCECMREIVPSRFEWSDLEKLSPSRPVRGKVARIETYVKKMCSVCAWQEGVCSAEAPSSVPRRGPIEDKCEWFEAKRKPWRGRI